MNTAAAEIPDVVKLGRGLLDRFGSLQLPPPAEYLDFLIALNAIWGFLLIACGLVYLLNGWKMFKMLVVLNAAAIGTLAGVLLGEAQGGRHGPLIGGAAGGLLLAALAWPLMKYAISVMGGLVGSCIGYGTWSYVAAALERPNLLQHAWAGALIGLVTLGLLAFVVFRLSVVVLTSVQGALMTVSGLLTLLLKYAPIKDSIYAPLCENHHMVPLLIGVPAVIGFALQQVAVAKKNKKKRLVTEGGGGG